MAAGGKSAAACGAALAHRSLRAATGLTEGMAFGGKRSVAGAHRRLRGHGAAGRARAKVRHAAVPAAFGRSGGRGPAADGVAAGRERPPGGCASFACFSRSPRWASRSGW